MSKKRKTQKKGPVSKTSKKDKPTATKKIAPKQNEPPFWKNNWLGGLIIFLLPLLLYLATYQFGYVLDDKIVLSENSFVQKGFGGIAEIFSTESFTGFLGEQQDLVAGARYRPLSIATFAVEYGLYGFNPGISHFINVLLYGLTGVLLFRMFFLFGFRADKNAWYWSLPFFAALLFVAHPIHTEVVANIKGRDEILALLLALATVYYSFKYVQLQKVWPLIVAGVIFFLALMAKENALTFLAVIPLSLYLFSKASTGKIFIAVLPLLLAAAIYLGIRINVIGYLLDSGKEVTGIMNDPFIGMSLGEQFATILFTLGEYIRLLLIPHPLTHDYYPYQVPIMNWGNWKVWLSLLLYVGLLVLGAWNWKKRSVPSWSIFYYLITLSIVSNIVVSLGAPMNERFMYMPSVGFCLGLAWLIKNPLAKRVGQSGKGVALGVMGGLMLGYAIKTIERVPAWENAMTLNRAAINVSTNSARANSYMAYSLYQQGLDEKNRTQKQAIYEEALPYVNRALEIYPEYSDALTCKAGLVAGLYQLNGNLDALLEEFYNIVKIRHIGFLEQYLKYLNDRANQQKMINFYYKTGYELLTLEQKNYPLAIQYLNYGLEIAPQNQSLLEATVIALFNAGNEVKASALSQQWVTVYPNSQVFKTYQ